MSKIALIIFFNLRGENKELRLRITFSCFINFLGKDLYQPRKKVVRVQTKSSKMSLIRVLPQVK